MDSLHRMELFTDAPWRKKSVHQIESKEIFEYLAQKRAATESSFDDDTEWRIVDLYESIAKEALASKDVERIASAMFYLGVATQELGSISHKQAVSFIANKFDREFPFLEKKMEQQVISSAAKEAAIEIWEEDVDEKKSLSDVCQDVYSLIHQAASSYTGNDKEELEFNEIILNRLPATADGLKKHLREVAPNYATRPGRRKK
ncbi:MAG: hypothetical protein V7629_03470 [Motiliproteus sp.]